MTGNLSHLIWALGLFVGSHFVLSWTPVRTRAVAAMGEAAFRGVYSALSLVTFAWIVAAYVAAPLVEVWQPPMALRHLPLTIMPIAFVLLVAGYTVRNPSAVVVLGAPGRTPGIIKVTRHPVMWAVGLWGIVHSLANGDAATMILAGAMAVLAVGGAWHIEIRRAADPAWQALCAESSFVPFVGLLRGRVRVTVGEVGWGRIVGGFALYGVVLWFHAAWFGISPFPLPVH